MFLIDSGRGEDGVPGLPRSADRFRGIGSSRLLMLSGTGPAEYLRSADINVCHDLPGVGENLQDHFNPCHRRVLRSIRLRSLSAPRSDASGRFPAPSVPQRAGLVIAIRDRRLRVRGRGGPFSRHPVSSRGEVRNREGDRHKPWLRHLFQQRLPASGISRDGSTGVGARGGASPVRFELLVCARRSQ